MTYKALTDTQKKVLTGTWPMSVSIGNTCARSTMDALRRRGLAIVRTSERGTHHWVLTPSGEKKQKELLAKEPKEPKEPKET